MGICYATSYLFGFPSRIKLSPLGILKFLATTLINQDKKVASVQVDEYGALARYSELIKTCHYINIVVQTTGGDSSSLNGKSESSNKTFANITIVIILNSIHNK